MVMRTQKEMNAPYAVLDASLRTFHMLQFPSLQSEPGRVHNSTGNFPVVSRQHIQESLTDIRAMLLFRPFSGKQVVTRKDKTCLVLGWRGR
jgi:hypothetical protein